MTIEEAAQKLQELTEAAKESNIDTNVPTGQAILTAIKSLEAWEKVRDEIETEKNAGCHTQYAGGLDFALSIIDKYRAESEDGENGSHNM